MPARTTALSVPRLLWILSLQVLFIAVVFLCQAQASPLLGYASIHEARHDLKVEIDPATKSVSGVDDITIRYSGASTADFRIATGAQVEEVLVDAEPAEFRKQNRVLRVELGDKEGSVTLRIRYRGVFDDPFEKQPFSMDNPGQGVSGTITDDAAFLLGGSAWYPLTGAEKSSFAITVGAPKGMYAITEGSLVEHKDEGDKSLSVWDVAEPSGALSLFAGQYVIKETDLRGIRIATYFSRDNAGLSDRYLAACKKHITFYEELHGPYAFKQFLVVENFFPTGYGFPSFTLLGGQVLRLPFIPATSLRHEIAHCWWGNGVYVDFKSGNWCEGLTSYVADYLAKEEQSAEEARGYRMRTLKNFAELAAGKRDFPLTQFRSRVDPATQAVGYGKAMMVFHMLRQRIGDMAFWQALRDVYADRLYKYTSWDHFLEAFAERGLLGADEVREFSRQWIEGKGAMQLGVSGVQVDGKGDRPVVSGVLTQEKPVFAGRVPLRIETEGAAYDDFITLDGRQTAFELEPADEPKRLLIDPDYDVFRTLHPAEIPATVNSVKGSQGLVGVIADEAPATWREIIFPGLLRGLSRGGGPIYSEDEFAEGSFSERDVFFFGMPRGAAREALLETLPKDVRLAEKDFALGDLVDSDEADTIFAAFKADGGRTFAIFLPKKGTDTGIIMDTARKITHYGRYGYLGFRGSVNQAKGVGPIGASPLHVELRGEK
jgi:hypothetical protein